MRDDHEIGTLRREFALDKFAVLRAPLLPVDVIAKLSTDLDFPKASANAEPETLEQIWSADRARVAGRVRELIHSPEIAEALWFATPDLWLAANTQLDLARAHKTDASLYRYVARMSYRATPFGLFASCSTLSVGARTVVEVAPAVQVRRHVRLDAAVVDRMYRMLEAESSFGELQWITNSTLYRIGERWRYVETIVDPDGGHQQQQAEVMNSEALAWCIAKAATAIEGDSLISGLQEESGASVDDVMSYLAELREAQVLVPASQLSVAGGEPFRVLLRDIASTGQKTDLRDAIAVAESHIDTLNSTPIGTHAHCREALDAMLRERLNASGIRSMFHVEAFRDSLDGTIGEELGPLILDAVPFLSPLTSAHDKSLQGFRDAFLARYGEAFVPLASALDEDIGIGFDKRGTSIAGLDPALTDLPLVDPSDEATPLRPRDRAIASKLASMWRASATELVLEANDVASLAETPRLPNAFAALITLLRNDVGLESPSLLLHYITGPSAAGLLARFAYGDHLLLKHLEHHAQAEAAAEPDVLYAEVVHSPRPRLVNVISRPLFRQLAIPYLGRADISRADTLLISELDVGVIASRIVLFSRKHGKEIRPRLSSAHAAYTASNLPVYRFFHALQNQEGQRGMGWSWGAFDAAPYLPRVRIGPVVLHPAQWFVPGERFRELRYLLDKPQRLIPQLGKLCAEYDLPRHAVLAEGDYHLPVDFNNPLSVEALLRSVYEQKHLVFHESLRTAESVAASGLDGHYSHEVVLPFVRRRAERTSSAADARLASARHVESRAQFLPGSEWLYLKVYCGPAVADRLIAECVGPILLNLAEENAIDGWFFIRFSDPEHHIRLRANGQAALLVSEILPRLTKALEEEIECGFVPRIEVGSYDREVARYGGQATIAAAEGVFCADTIAAVNLIRENRCGTITHPRHQLMAAAADSMLALFRLSMNERLAFARRMRAAYESELFDDPAGIRRVMAGKVRDNRLPLRSLLVRSDRSASAHRVSAILDAWRARCEPLANQFIREAERDTLSAPLSDIIASLIHMQVNRLARSSARHLEFVVYDLLAQHYSSECARHSPS